MDAKRQTAGGVATKRAKALASANAWANLKGGAASAAGREADRACRAADAAVNRAWRAEAAWWKALDKVSRLAPKAGKVLQFKRRNLPVAAQG